MLWVLGLRHVLGIARILMHRIGWALKVTYSAYALRVWCRYAGASVREKMGGGALKGRACLSNQYPISEFALEFQRPLPRGVTD